VQDGPRSCAGAQRLRAFLTAAGAVGEQLAFRGGHEIPYPVLQKTGELLAEVLTPT